MASLSPRQRIAAATAIATAVALVSFLGGRVTAPEPTGNPVTTTTLPGRSVPKPRAGLVPTPTLPPQPTAAPISPPGSFGGVTIGTTCAGVDVTGTLTTNQSTHNGTGLLGWISDLAQVPDGSYVSFPSGNCYQVDGTLYLLNRNNLTFDGNGTAANKGSDGAKFQAITNGLLVPVTDQTFLNASHNWPSRRAQWWVKGGTNITIKNMAIQGFCDANPAYSGTATDPAHCGLNRVSGDLVYGGQYGIAFGGVIGAAALNVTVKWTQSDAIGLLADNPGNPAVMASQITVSNSDLEHTDRQGVSFTGCTTCWVTRSTVGDVAISPFDLEPISTTFNTHTTITLNTVLTHKSNFFMTATGASNVVNGDIDVEGNTETGGLLAMAVGNSNGIGNTGLRIADNTGDTAYGNQNLILVDSFSNVAILRNTVPMGNNKTFVSFGAVSNAQVDSNTLTVGTGVTCVGVDASDLGRSNWTNTRNTGCT